MSLKVYFNSYPLSPTSFVSNVISPLANCSAYSVTLDNSDPSGKIGVTNTSTFPLPALSDLTVSIAPFSLILCGRE